jgi:hypothetical protein
MSKFCYCRMGHELDGWREHWQHWIFFFLNKHEAHWCWSWSVFVHPCLLEPALF